jgi:hypothetical protein
MKGASMLAMLNSLGVTASLSRPAVSNDNPFSESVAVVAPPVSVLTATDSDAVSPMPILVA